MSRRVLFSVVMSAACLSGCGDPITNIPPLPGDTAFHDANDKAVRSAEAAGLLSVLKQWAPEGPYAVSLPRGTSQATYNEVLAKLPAGGVVVLDNPQLPVYKVVRVRIRAWNGQVEVIKPGLAGTPDQLISVYVSVDTRGWYAVRNRLWRLPIEKALQISQENFDEPGTQPKAEPKAEPKSDTPPAPGTPPADGAPQLKGDDNKPQ